MPKLASVLAIRVLPPLAAQPVGERLAGLNAGTDKFTSDFNTMMRDGARASARAAPLERPESAPSAPIGLPADAPESPRSAHEPPRRLPGASPLAYVRVTSI